MEHIPSHKKKERNKIKLTYSNYQICKITVITAIHYIYKPKNDIQKTNRMQNEKYSKPNNFSQHSKLKKRYGSNYLITSTIISKFSDCRISTFLPDAPTISFLIFNMSWETTISPIASS